MNWQPIETAPKDGYPLMLCCRTPYKPFFGYWDSVDGAWFEAAMDYMLASRFKSDRGYQILNLN